MVISPTSAYSLEHLQGQDEIDEDFYRICLLAPIIQELVRERHLFCSTPVAAEILALTASRAWHFFLTVTSGDACRGKAQ